MTEQRQHVRYQVEFPAILGGDCAGMGIVYNLGMGGCKIVSDLEVRAGSLLSIHLKVSDQSSAIVIQAARIQWTMKFEFGVEFHEMQGQERVRLEKFLATQVSIAA
jgi:PilZ domain